MADTILFDNGTHRNILLEDSGSAGMAVQANQHIIVHNGEAHAARSGRAQGL